MMKPAKEGLLMKSTYERLGGGYYKVGDYLLPNVAVPESPQIGIWGERRRKYRQEHDKTTSTAMVLDDSLISYLAFLMVSFFMCLAFHFLRLLPFKNRCILFFMGKNTPTEQKRFLRKVFDSEEGVLLTVCPIKRRE
jgi:hypothetical protein